MLANTFKFTKTTIDWAGMEKAFHNQFRVVASRNYSDKKGVLPDGIVLTLMVVKDDFDYGVDRDGNPRESNLYQNFDVTILSRKVQPKKGDIVKLLDFDQEHSFAINFDLILRFGACEIIQSQGAKTNA